MKNMNNKQRNEDISQFLVAWEIDSIVEDFFQTTQFSELTSAAYTLLIKKIETIRQMSEFGEMTTQKHLDPIQYDENQFKEEIQNAIKYQLFVKINELVKEDPCVKKIIAKTISKNRYRNLMREALSACNDLVGIFR